MRCCAVSLQHLRTNEVDAVTDTFEQMLDNGFEFTWAWN
jgi:hypothetical protein